jgi:hypothetical protein
MMRRSIPAFRTVAILIPESGVMVDRFLLALPGAWQRGEGGRRGDGWYHLSAPLEGWVEAHSLVIADAGCELALR